MDQFGAPALPAEMSFAGSVVRENSIRQRFTHQYAKKGQQGTTARYLEEVERDRQARNETFFRPDTRTDPRLAGFSSTREWIMEQVLLGSTGSTSFPRGAPATTRNEGTLLDNIKDLGQLLAEWQKNINEAAFLWVLKLEFVKQELLKRILILETEFLARREPYVDEHLAKWIEEREEAGIRSYPRRDYLPAVVNVNGAFAIDEERTRAEKARLIQEMIQEETRIVTGKILELQNQWTNTQLTEEERAKLVRVRKELKYLQEFFQPDRNEAGQELRTGDDRRRDSNRPSWEPMTVFFPWPDKNFKEKVRRTSLMTRLDSRNYTTNADTDTREQHQQQQHQASSEDNRIFRQSFLQALQRKFHRRLKSELDEAIRPVVPPNSADNNSPPVQVQNLLVSQALPRNIVGRAGLRLTVPLMKERFFKEIILENDMPEVHLGGGFVPPSSSTASGGGRAGLNPSTTASSSSTSSQQQHSIYRTTGAAPAPAGPQPQVAGSSSGRGGVTYLGPALEVHVQTEPVQSSAGAAERQVAGTSRAREVEPRAAQEPQAAAPAAQLASAPARPQRRGIVNRRLSEFATQGGGQQR
ncbi:unnamed protein product [Amoebophrya sp. A120]|nr:unnamed protein product [Amoebophrya sp. A120]|eukprot:GSA120T00022363001.1